MPSLRPPSGKKHVPMGTKLFWLIVDAGGSLTQAQIRRRASNNWSAAEITQGIRECGDLLEVSEAHARGSHRRSRRITLTVRGWAAAAELRAGYRPLRLTTAELKAAVAMLQSEDDPWACQIQKDTEEAALWREHADDVRTGRRVCRLRDWVKTVGAFGPRTYAEYRKQVADRARATLAARGGFHPTPPSTDEAMPIIPPPTIPMPAPTPISAPVPPHLPPGGFCERCHMNAESCHCKNPIPGPISDASYYRPSPYTDVRPTMQSTPSNSALAEKIKASGYTVRNGLVLYGGDRWITPEEWLKKESYRLGS